MHEVGADYQSKTTMYQRTPYDLICEMIRKNEIPDGYKSMTKELKKKMTDIKNFLRARYFVDMRGLEIRKFIWVWKELREKNNDIGLLPQGIVREIAEYI